MNIVLGPYHPHLEDALAGEVRSRRARDRLTPLLLVVPSETLRRRVKTLLAHEHGLHLLNTHILTFSQVTLNLFHEAHGPEKPTLRDETFMEEALKRVLPAHRRFAHIAENEGGCAALWQCLRDLKDAMVDPELALDALREDHFAGRDRDALHGLFELHREVTHRFPEWRAQDRQDLDGLAGLEAPLSRWLGQFARICYYGFYELTQTQLELFQSIAAHHPVTLFYPLAQGHPDWSFAQDFFDRYLRGLAGADDVVDLLGGGAGSGTASSGPEPDAPGHPKPNGSVIGGGGLPRPGTPPRREVLDCANPRDEVLTVAKHLLRLVEEEGLDFRQAGVVARTLDPYLPWIREIFPAHGIPFHTPAREPLHRSQRVRAVLALLDLPVRDYPRAAVIDLLASHHFNFAGVLGSRTEPRPELWDVATRSLGIGRGLGEWRRLERYRDTPLELNLVDEEEEGRRLRVDSEQLGALLDAVEALHAELNALPREAAWSDLAARWRALLDRFLIPGPDDGEAEVTRAIDNVFAGLAALDAVGGRVALPDFVAALRKSLDRASVAPMRVPVPGVQVLDAGAARGIPFRALFLVGMNEGVFPRTIREDPFLPDRARRVLETVLGYKISSKLAGYDEERLLFALLSGAADERLCCTWPRADAAGRALAPSWYLRAVAPAADTDGGGMESRSIPKSALGKRGTPPFDDPRWLLPEELAVRRALSGEDPRTHARIAGASMENLDKSLAAIRALNDGAGAPGPFDGVTGPLPEAWDRLLERRISPTTLEAYGRCPFQYFAGRVLRLERLERPEWSAPIQALEQGQICHEILQAFYEDLDRALGDGWRGWLDSAAARVLSAFEERSPTGYPAVWEAAKEELLAMLREAVRADRQEMARSGFLPVGFEKDLTAQLNADWPEDLRGLPLQGRLDRVDHDARGGRYRVIDYKYKSGKEPGAVDKDPVRAALQARRLQLPIYLLLAAGNEIGREAAGADAIDAAWYFLAPRWEDGPLVAKELSGQSWREPAGAKIRETVARLLRGMRDGEFPLVKGDYCRFCQVSEICRKDHFPSVSRATRHPAAEALARIRQMKVTGETGTS
ncbi:MAG: exodeoxyribonuclease V subunit gamma [Deltaproteobacteria bacterium]|nr:exodeoxyribonuclease V subunit gamma [Deltaproteobacteria bacterium]